MELMEKDRMCFLIVAHRIEFENGDNISKRLRSFADTLNSYTTINITRVDVFNTVLRPGTTYISLLTSKGLLNTDNIDIMKTELQKYISNSNIEKDDIKDTKITSFRTVRKYI